MFSRRKHQFGMAIKPAHISSFSAESAMTIMSSELQRPQGALCLLASLLDSESKWRLIKQTAGQAQGTGRTVLL